MSAGEERRTPAGTAEPGGLASPIGAAARTARVRRPARPGPLLPVHPAPVTTLPAPPPVVLRPAEARASIIRSDLMSTIYDSVLQQLGGGNLSQLSQQIGADESTTQRAVQAALPMLLGGLARNSARPEGAASLAGALNDHRGGGMLQNLGGLIGNPQSGPGAGILGHIFGGRRDTVEQGVGQATGLDRQLIGKLLMVLAPIVMGVLARRRFGEDQAGGTPPAAPRADAAPPADDLGPMLQRETEEAAQKAPGGLGGLLGMLDRDGDGNPLNDLGKLGGGLGGLGGMLGGR